MAFKFNPFIGNFDIVGSTGGTLPSVVANYSALPDPTTVGGKFYWVSNSQGTRWLPGSLGGTYYSAGMYYSNGVSWEFLDVPYQATQSEVDTGTNNDKFVTTSTFTNANKWITKANVSGQIFTGSISATNLSGTNTGDQTTESLNAVGKSDYNNNFLLMGG